MFKHLIDSKKLAGAVCLIWKNGKIVHKESQGYKNLETGELLDFDTIFRIASMTKPITSVLAMMLYEQGKFELNDPITKWFPAFQEMKVLKNTNTELTESVGANRPITILDLLTHRAGFTYGEFHTGQLREAYHKTLGGDIDTALTNEEWVKGLANLPLINQPGELFNYGKSTDLLGLLISKIEKKSLGEVMYQNIFSPLDMQDTFFYVPLEKKKRCAANFGYDEAGNVITLDNVPLNMAFKDRPIDLEFESGSGGLWSTLDDYLKFAKIFVEHGTSNGVQILKQETIELMCSNQLSPSQREHSKLMGTPMFKDFYGFGLGLAVVMTENDWSSIPCTGSVGSVGWPGAYGGWWSADPEKKAIAIFLTHSMTEPNQLANGIGLDVYAAIDIFASYYKSNVLSVN